MKKLFCLLKILGCISLLFLFSCSKNNLVTERPDESYETPHIQTTPSVISFPAEIDIKSLESVINSKLQGEIYSNDSVSKNLALRIWKAEDFTIYLTGNELTYRVPLKIWAKARFGLKKFGLNISDSKEINAQIALNFTTKLWLQPDWSLKTITNFESYEWIEKPTINLGGFNLPVTSIADAVLNNSRNKLSGKIDSVISHKYTLKNIINPLWKALQQPIKSANNMNVWFRLIPLEVYAQPLFAENGKLKENIGIKANTEIFVGKPPRNNAIPDIPDIQFKDTLNDQFSISMMTNVSYGEVTRLAKSYLVNKTFSSGTHSVTIKDLNIYGSKNKLIVEASVKGSLNGKLYFTGEPWYDPKDSMLKVRNFNFEIHTFNALITAGSWLMHHKIVDKIQEKMSYPVGSKIEESKKLIQTMFNNKNIGYDVYINGQLNDLSVGGIYLTKENIGAHIMLTGKMSVKMNNN